MPRNNTIIYNLFPPLAGKFHKWIPHIERASRMGFTWIFLNPIQHPGFSGSLYSIKYYFGLNPQFADETLGQTPDQQFKAVTRKAHELGLGMMTDLVINHCAIDSPLIDERPEWFMWGKRGKIAHPWCMDKGNKVVWRDLAKFDHLGGADPEGLFEFCLRIVDHLVGLGFKGFRCDAAYQVPSGIWERLIKESRAKHGELLFAAETLGCTQKQTLETAAAGFDMIFNSSKWWNMTSPWLLEQYDESRKVAPSIGFPESHDTTRLIEDVGGNIDVMKQRYLFSALFSGGVLMPMGFEFAFKRRLHVVKTRPSDWENTGIDLSGYISEVNKLKARLPILNEDAQTEIISLPNKKVLGIRKYSSDSSSLLMILNKHMNDPQWLETDSPAALLGATSKVEDVTPCAHTRTDPNSLLKVELGPARSLVFYSPGT